MKTEKKTLENKNLETMVKFVHARLLFTLTDIVICFRPWVSIHGIHHWNILLKIQIYTENLSHKLNPCVRIDETSKCLPIIMYGSKLDVKGYDYQRFTIELAII